MTATFTVSCPGQAASRGTFTTWDVPTIGMVGCDSRHIPSAGSTARSIRKPYCD